jgi:tRNA-(ms[2]io[6]A)-hydroxylase
VAAAQDAGFELLVATPPQWAAAMLPHVGELLVEQAQLEKKAAAAAVQFLFRLPVGPASLRELSALAREELVHFERTVQLLQRRGIASAPQQPSPYAERLKAVAAGALAERLADELLVAAAIEARSRERLGLLAVAFRDQDPALAGFYADLAAAEARHAPLYAQLAAEVVGPQRVAQRQRAVLQHEAAVLRALPWAPRLHSGFAGGHGC